MFVLYVIGAAVGVSYFPGHAWTGLIIGVVGATAFIFFTIGEGNTKNIAVMIAYWASARVFPEPYNSALFMSAMAAFAYSFLILGKSFTILRAGFSLFGATNRLTNTIEIFNPVFLIPNIEKFMQKFNKIVGIGFAIYFLEMIAK